ncbi:MAG: dihydrofolate reductase [Bdellovibrionota bacterium]|nr:dihydrofolate reductase [Bdellovibrionota bacterium]
MILSMIAAMGKNRVIGKDNQMMWHLPREFQYFKDVTSGHCIILGRKNFEAIGRPLPNRTNIIVTRQDDYKAADCVVVNSLDEAIKYAKDHGETEAFITGGGQIYKEMIDKVQRIYLTEVDYSEEGDVYFPEFDESKFNKEIVRSQEVDEKNKYRWDAYLYTLKN